MVGRHGAVGPPPGADLQVFEAEQRGLALEHGERVFHGGAVGPHVSAEMREVVAHRRIVVGVVRVLGCDLAPLVDLEEVVERRVVAARGAREHVRELHVLELEAHVELAHEGRAVEGQRDGLAVVVSNGRPVRFCVESATRAIDRVVPVG